MVSSSSPNGKQTNTFDFSTATPQMQKPQLLEPDFSIAGGPSIKQYHVLNDKRHILVMKLCFHKPSSNELSKYNRKSSELALVI